jgi:hypothetical protein
VKKILIAVMALLITLGLLGIGTYGVFAKPEDTNITDYGKLSLDVLGKNTINESYSFGNIKPGDSEGWNGAKNISGMSWTVKNTGTIDGSLEISIENINDNGSNLSKQIIPQLRINDVLISEFSDISNFPVFRRTLASGEEAKVEIAWKFNENAGNEYQGASTTYNVKFYIAAPSEDTNTTINAGAIQSNLTDKSQSASIDVAGITESSIEVKGINEQSADNKQVINVLGFTGLNPIIPISGFAILLAGFIVLIIEVERKRKIKNSIHKN